MKLPSRNNKYVKVAALFLALSIFAIYIFNNSQEFKKLSEVGFLDIVIIVIGQLTVLAANALIFQHIARMSEKNLLLTKSFEITAYSALVNFFGFLQAGVGLRGVYLKKKLNIKYKQYIGFTVLQYVFLFGISFAIILFGLITIYYSILAAIGSLMLSICVAPLLYRLIAKIQNEKIKKLTNIVPRITKSHLATMLLLVCVQVLGSFIAYSSELRVIDATPTLAGLLIFTGVSQFSIILAITPGAIGIREGLLLIASGAMSISVSDIVVSSTLDRLVLFITYLLILPLALAARKANKPLLSNEEK